MTENKATERKNFKSKSYHDKAVRVRLTKKDREKLEACSIATSKTMSEFLRDLVHEAFEKSFK